MNVQALVEIRDNINAQIHALFALGYKLSDSEVQALYTVSGEFTEQINNATAPY